MREEKANLVEWANLLFIIGFIYYLLTSLSRIMGYIAVRVPIHPIRIIGKRMRERERKVKINMYKSLMDVRPTLAATLKCVLDIIGLR